MHNLMTQTIKLLLLVAVLVSCLATAAVVSNPVTASSRISFKNKSECMEYVMDGTNIIRNHAIQNAKVNKQLAEKLCAEY